MEAESSGGLVSPSGEFASLFFDQVGYFASIKLCQALSRQGAKIKIPAVRCHYLLWSSAQCFDWWENWAKLNQLNTLFLCCFALYLLVAYWQTKKAGFCTKLQKIFKWPCEDQRVLQYWSFVSSLLIRRNWPTRGKCTTRAYRLRMGVACLSDLLCIERPAWQQSCFCLVSSSI
jgi:hypothetical protein